MTAKLLVVDDEPRTAELTAEILRRAGYSVDVAGSGTEALEQVRLASPDLMLLDYEMPDMEAPEVLDSLRSGGERIAFPVIILTGARHSPADQVVGIERGATDYIVKGTDRQVMLARVRGALRERASAPGAVVRGRLHVDAARGEARLGDRHLKLERRPLLMLQLLANRSGEVVSRAISSRSVGSDTGSSSRTELAGALHRLRSTLARARAELELADADGDAPPVDKLLGDLGEALDLLGAVETAAFAIVHVLVLDDDEQRAALKAARPIVVTGAADPRSRAIAEGFDAFDYLIKPVEMEELAAAVSRRMAAESQ